MPNCGLNKWLRWLVSDSFLCLVYKQMNGLGTNTQPRVDAQYLYNKPSMLLHWNYSEMTFLYELFFFVKTIFPIWSSFQS